MINTIYDVRKVLGLQKYNILTNLVKECVYKHYPFIKYITLAKQIINNKSCIIYLWEYYTMVLG